MASEQKASKGQVVTGAHSNNHQVSVTDFSLVRLLGSGAFGKVYLARKVGPGADRGRVYALKALKKATILSKVKGAEHTIAERKILEAVRQCPFLVTLHYAFQTDTKLFLVLDYLGGGELFTHLVQRGKFTVEETTFYAAELLVALSALHDLGVIYRDLKLENILLDNEGHVVLTDFGLSRKFNHWEHEQRTYSYCGTVEYMAPEVVDKGRGYDFAADWWSLGVLTYELLTGTSPFTLAGHDNSQQAVRKRVLDGKYPPLSSSFPMATRAFVESLLIKDPHKRLGHNGADEIRGHAFFFKISWADIVNRKVSPPFRPLIRNDSDCQNFSSEFTSQLPSDVNLSTSPGAPHISPKIFRDYSYIAPFHIDETGAEIAPITPQASSSSSSSSKHHSSDVEMQIDAYIGGPTERLRLLQKFKATDFFVKYRIDFDGAPIGRGSFSTVRRCYNNETNEEFAVKILNRCVRVDSEIQTLSACQGHPNIIRLVEVMHDKHNSYLVCELLRGGELLSQIQKKTTFRESEARRVYQMVVDAVRFMHEKNVAHLDLKPENIIFVDQSPQSQCKVVDFGFARFIRDLNDVEVQCYTLQYAAPEVLFSQSYSPMCDLWSLGVILYVMLSGHVPFVADSPENMANLVRSCHYELERDEWRNVSAAAKDLIRRLLTVEQTDRLTMAELIEHPWLTMEKVDQNAMLMTPDVLRDNRGETGSRIHRALAAFFKVTRDIGIKEANAPVAKRRKKLGGSKVSKGDLLTDEKADKDKDKGNKLNDHVIHKVASEAVFHLKPPPNVSGGVNNSVRSGGSTPTHVAVQTPNFNIGGDAASSTSSHHHRSGGGGRCAVGITIPEQVEPSPRSSRTNLLQVTGDQASSSSNQISVLAKSAVSSPNLRQLDIGAAATTPTSQPLFTTQLSQVSTVSGNSPPTTFGIFLTISPPPPSPSPSKQETAAAPAADDKASTTSNK